MKNLTKRQCSAISDVLTRIQGIRRMNGEIPGLREMEDSIQEAFPEIASIQLEVSQEVDAFLKKLGL